MTDWFLTFDESHFCIFPIGLPGLDIIHTFVMQCEPWKPCCCYRCFLSALLWKKKISACGSCLTERDLIQINNRPVVGKHSITLERAEVERLKFFFSLFRVLFCFLNWDSCLHSSSLLTSHLPVCWFTCWLLHVVTCYIVGYMYASETVIKVCWKSLQVRKAKNLYTTIKDLVPFALKVSTLTKLHLFVS